MHVTKKGRDDEKTKSYDRGIFNKRLKECQMKIMQVK